MRLIIPRYTCDYYKFISIYPARLLLLLDLAVYGRRDVEIKLLNRLMLFTHNNEQRQLK